MNALMNIFCKIKIFCFRRHGQRAARRGGGGGSSTVQVREESPRGVASDAATEFPHEEPFLVKFLIYLCKICNLLSVCDMRHSIVDSESLCVKKIAHEYLFFMM